MGGLAGFIGTFIIGPRVGLFKPETKLAYINDDLLLDEDDSQKERRDDILSSDSSDNPIEPDDNYNFK